MSNIPQLKRDGLMIKYAGWDGAFVPARDPNYDNARQYKNSAEVWFGDARVVVHGEYLPTEADCDGDFDVQACMVGGIDILSGLTGEQIDVLATQAYAQCRGRK